MNENFYNFRCAKCGRESVAVFSQISYADALDLLTAQNWLWLTIDPRTPDGPIALCQWCRLDFDGLLASPHCLVNAV